MWMPLYTEWPLGILKLCFQVRRRDTVRMIYQHWYKTVFLFTCKGCLWKWWINFIISYINIYIKKKKQFNVCNVMFLWYVLFPGQYGIPRPWYFIFQLNYWGGVPLEAGLPIPPVPCDQPDGKNILQATCAEFESNQFKIRFILC